MTWKEFKELVDRKLQEQGEDGTAKIWFIDVTAPTEDIQVSIDENGDIYVAD